MKSRYLFLLLIPGLAFAEDDFGRLFTTPQERSKLEYLRKITNPAKLSEPVADAVVADEPSWPSALSVQGYVKRNDGKQGTVWVNGKPVQENSSSDGVTVGRIPHQGNQIPLKLPGSGKTLRLKAGQVYSMETDSIREDTAETNSDQSSSQE